MSKSICLELDNVHKSFLQGKEKLNILQGASLQIEQGEIVALIGPSGSGKSTLLHIAGLLDKVDTGGVIINGIDCGKANDYEQTLLRRKMIGFVYQSHHLLQEFNAIENIIIPQLILGRTRSQAYDQARELMQAVGLQKRETHFPSQLSGGEQQRVAIARAMANKPCLFLADEPTGNLDPLTCEQVSEMLISFLKTYDLAALIVTHNYGFAAKADRMVTLKDGKLIKV